MSPLSASAELLVLHLWFASRSSCLRYSGPGPGDVARRSRRGRRVQVDPVRRQRVDGLPASERLACSLPAGLGLGAGRRSGLPLSQAAPTADLPGRRTDFNGRADGRGQGRRNRATAGGRPGRSGDAVERRVDSPNEEVLAVSALLNGRFSSPPLARCR